MKKFKVLLAVFFLGMQALLAQDKWYITVTMPTQMDNAGYDALFAKIGTAGLSNCFSEYHAAGANPAGGYFGFTTFKSKAQCEARLATLKPFLGSVSPTPYEVYKVIPGKNAAAMSAKAVIVFFDVKGQTEAQYDKILAHLEKAGALNNPARMYHVAYKTPDGIKVIDVWSDAEAFTAAGSNLMPAIQAAGVNPPPPAIIPVHAIRIPTQADRNLDVTLMDYAAFGRGDIPTILASLSEDCNWSHVGNANVIPFAGTFIGKAGVARFFENVSKSIQVTQFEPGNFRSTANSVTCTVLISGKVLATGKPYTNTVEQTFWFDANGKVNKWATNGDVSGLEMAFVK
jgi:hypothetical protein